MEPKEYAEYIISYLKYYKKRGKNPKIFVATDDKNYLSSLLDIVSSNCNITVCNVTEDIRYIQDVERSETPLPVFKMKLSKYRIGIEVITDILFLSKCTWFIHSASAVAESVFYHNLELHFKSVHLEYVRNRQVPFWFNSHI